MIENRITKSQLRREIEMSLEYEMLLTEIDKRFETEKERHAVRWAYLEMFLKKAIDGKPHIRFHYPINVDSVLRHVQDEFEFLNNGGRCYGK